MAEIFSLLPQRKVFIAGPLELLKLVRSNFSLFLLSFRFVIIAVSYFSIHFFYLSFFLSSSISSSFYFSVFFLSSSFYLSSFYSNLYFLPYDVLHASISCSSLCFSSLMLSLSLLLHLSPLNLRLFLFPFFSSFFLFLCRCVSIHTSSLYQILFLFLLCFFTRRLSFFLFYSLYIFVLEVLFIRTAPVSLYSESF